MGKQASKLKGRDNVIAVNLRKLMERENISHEKLAKEVGCSRQAISQYLDGSSAPNIDKLLSIADYFNVSLDYMLGREEKPNDRELINHVCDYTGLSCEAIETIGIEILGDDIRAVLNTFLKGYKGKENYRMTEPFRAFCNSIIEYQSAATESNVLFSEYYNKGVTLEDLSDSDRDKLFEDEKIITDRVNAAEYRVLTCALDMVKLLGNSDLRRQFDRDKLDYLLG